MIAETKNISAAADQLKISQPALSSQLKKLENTLGTVLFDRTKQPL
ncbi:MAG: LysR family transcriptional regulator, partial [Firmicutes bacterium]|nr:LysR family transcriptional regulator [Bacillota bacterium]